MALEKRDFDVVVVGSGPNGLAAAITLQQQGLRVLVVERKSTIGGGMRTMELTLPGFKHDVCSAIHPLASASPFFSALPLHEHGLSFVHPTFSAAHPFDNGDTAVLEKSLDNTAQLLGEDKSAYKKLIEDIVTNWSLIAADVLGPLGIPKNPVAFTQFGLKAISSASWLNRNFKSLKAKSFFAGMAAHSMVPLSFPATSGIALVLLANGHLKGWQIPKGGSQSIADALASYFVKSGGEIKTDFHVTSLNQLPGCHAILFDTGPHQMLKIAGHKFSSLYKRQLQRYKYGMGVFKIDWALDDVIPFKSAEAKSAGTVHLGNSYSEITASENDAWNGKHSYKPFVLLAQQSVFDSSRAPQGKHTGWAYCHVPNGSTVDMTKIIEEQVERFAPGFKERILARHTYNSEQMEEYNNNYVGGDINGGAITINQLFTRPALRLSPYRTSSKGLYICSSSTPPGGGVHGMCGYYAAKRALKDVFKIHI